VLVKGVIAFGSMSACSRKQTTTHEHSRVRSLVVEGYGGALMNDMKRMKRECS
jgi:hypothetical protein